MHAVSHSLAHRAPPATRTRVRWQPYGSMPSSSMTASLPSPTSTYLNTPASSTPSSRSLRHPHNFNHLRRPTVKAVPQTAKEISVRDLSKNKFALGLVDQAVKSLCEIWRTQDIPAIFVSCAKTNTGGNAIEEGSSHHQQNSRSLLAHSRRSSPIPNSTSSGFSDAGHSQSKGGLLPIRGFVHEVLRRSRTSGCVLQTALCYIEAIRPKVPELLQRRKAGEMRWKEPGLADRTPDTTNTGLQQQAEECMSLDSIINTDACVIINPMPATKTAAKFDPSPNGNGARVPKQLDLVSSIAELPSPLLCPRRSFLAALILASKFLQDKCYSNRAWAKLSGLPPREIGRCERALGEALEWRLWVGKVPAMSQSSATPVHRPLHRARSESNLKLLPSEQSPFLIRSDHVLPASPDRSLRRCSTLPADAFATGQNADIPSTDSQPMLCGDLDVPCTIPTQLLVIPSVPVEMKDSPGSQASTPSLAYSPSSSESSGGDRTVQASFQEDIYTAPTFDDRNTCMPCVDFPDGLCIKNSQLEEYLPYRWQPEESTFVS